MKQKNLYLALVVAIGLVGCGSSSKGTTPSKPADSKPAPTKPAKPAKPADPAPDTSKGETDFDTLGINLNANAQTAKFAEDESYGGQVWIKTGKDSILTFGDKFPADTIQNTPGLSKVKISNPLLTNIVVAQKKATEGKVGEYWYVGQYAGDSGADLTKKEAKNHSIQAVNSGEAGAAITLATVGSVIIGNEVVLPTGTKSAATDATKAEESMKVVKRATLVAANGQLKALQSGLITDVNDVAGFGNIDGNDFLGEESDFNSDHNKTAAEASIVGNAAAKGLFEKNGARVFGRYYNTSIDHADGHKIANSYKDVTTYEETGKHLLQANPMTLNHVQYGRITVNLNPDALRSDDVNGLKAHMQPFVAKGSKNAVDVYFYRGTTPTTIKQMGELPADAVYSYSGHALMYGLDNSDHQSGTGNAPNSLVGSKDKHMLGNFVSLTYDVGGKAVKDGQVYNVWIDDEKVKKTRKDVLVTFNGKVTGNTVLGTADRAYDPGQDDNAFIATFYGDKAQEIGGQFGVKRQDKVSNKLGWGGVFGAHRTIVTDTGIMPLIDVE